MRKPSIPTKLVIAKNLEEFIFEFEQYLIQNQIKDLLIISGETQLNNLTWNLINGIKSSINIDVIKSEDTEKIQKQYSWILGLGGGKVLDKAKYLAYCQEASFISVPTLIAHDGICSPVAVLNNKSLGAVMPHSLFVPLFIIKSSPLIHIKAGIGELIANLSAIEDWKLAHLNNNEEINDFAIMISKKAVSDIIQKLKINFIEKIFSNAEEFLRDENFLFTLTESLALSGIAMSISGNTRPCSGGEHLISHAIDQIYGHGVKAPHGIQVLIATLFLEQYRTGSSFSSSIESLKELKEFLMFYNLPMSFSDIGISDNELKEIIRIAPQTRKDRYSILDQIFIKNH
jgi:glycerol-1-phosphate dehydrogenase [NAD(P)+]